MGRSVSTPNNTALVEYLHLEQDRYYCHDCGETFDDPARVEQACGHIHPVCPHCDSMDFSEQDSQLLFDDFNEDLETLLKEAFPSLAPDEKWLGREDKVLLSNSYAYFGWSEYCGLVAVWVSAKEKDWRASSAWEAMRDRWISSIEKKFAKTVGKAWGSPLTKLGTFSNGEAVFSKKG